MAKIIIYTKIYEELLYNSVFLQGFLIKYFRSKPEEFEFGVGIKKKDYDTVKASLKTNFNKKATI